MTFTAVVTSHDYPEGLGWALEDLLYQSRLPDQTVILVSPVESTLDGWGEFALQLPALTIEFTPDMDDWGHAKRARGLELATGDYVGWFNDDDRYDPSYVGLMMGAAEEDQADVVYCAWNAIPDCTFKGESSTSGNFIVRRELALRVGYPEPPHRYATDADFIDSLAAKTNRIVRLDDVLYHHNARPRTVAA